MNLTGINLSMPKTIETIQCMTNNQVNVKCFVETYCGQFNAHLHLVGICIIIAFCLNNWGFKWFIRNSDKFIKEWDKTDIWYSISYILDFRIDFQNGKSIESQYYDLRIPFNCAYWINYTNSILMLIMLVYIGLLLYLKIV